MKKSDLAIVTKFCLFLITLLALAYFAHSEVLKSKDLWFDLADAGLKKAYLFNGLFTMVIFSILMYLKEKHMASLGFFFLGGSFLKVIFFFFFFKPGYKADGDISKLEFSEFFVPYGICLAFEVFYLVRVLMKEQD